MYSAHPRGKGVKRFVNFMHLFWMHQTIMYISIVNRFPFIFKPVSYAIEQKSIFSDPVDPVRHRPLLCAEDLMAVDIIDPFYHPGAV